MFLSPLKIHEQPPAFFFRGYFTHPSIHPPTPHPKIRRRFPHRPHLMPLVLLGIAAGKTRQLFILQTKKLGFLPMDGTQPGSSSPFLPFLLQDHPHQVVEGVVDPEISRRRGGFFFADGAGTTPVLPRFAHAALAEVVAAGKGHGLPKRLVTDGAEQFFLQVG